MADDYQFKDAAGTVLLSRAKEVAAGIYSNLVHLMMGGSEVSRANPIPIAAAASSPSASFTRPANTTTYAAGELVANSETAGSVVPMQFTVAKEDGGSYLLRRARLEKTSTTTANAWFRLFLFTSAPTPTNGDNGTFVVSKATFIGAYDFVFNQTFSDGAFAIASGPVGASEIAGKLPSGTVVHGLLRAEAPYVPTSGEVFTGYLDAY